MSRFRKTVKIARDGLIILFVTLVLLELALRISHFIHPSCFFPQDSYNRWRGKPFSMSCGFPLNSKGFNGREFEKKKAEGTFRIIVIGDSFVFGTVSQKDVFTYLLEERLLHVKKVEVINMGICGTGPDHYRDLLMREGLELNPNLVIVGFFMGNDFVFRELRYERQRYSLFLDTYVVSLAVALFNLTARPQGLTYDGEQRCDDNNPNLDEESYLKLEAERSWIYVKSHSMFGVCLTKATNYLIDIKRLCDWKGTRLLVVLMPDEVQVDRGLQKAVLGELKGPDLDFALPNRELSDALTREKIDYLDLLETFRLASDGRRLYKPNDSHWNRAGNALAADAIHDYLERSRAPVVSSPQGIRSR